MANFREKHDAVTSVNCSLVFVIAQETLQSLSCILIQILPICDLMEIVCEWRFITIDMDEIVIDVRNKYEDFL